MGQRIIYSCDWCGVDAPKSGCVGGGWSPKVDTPRGPRCLCAACVTRLEQAINLCEDEVKKSPTGSDLRHREGER